MPLVTAAYLAYAGGLLAGFAGFGAPLLALCAAVFLLILVRGPLVRLALPLVLAAAVATSAGSRAQVVASRTPIAADTLDVLGRARARAARTIDAVFRADAPLARALLVADQQQIPREVRNRYATAGIVHMLSISGMHVTVIAAAVQLVLLMLRLPMRTSSLVTAGVIGAYVAVIGFPAPAVRSAVMLSVALAAQALQRPTSPWASLAIGAAVPLVDPRVVLDLGYQLSVAGMAGLTASGELARRALEPRLDGWRLMLSREVATGVVATLVSAPLVAWAFGRISLIGPVTNLLAAPVMAVLQPVLFLALIVAPARPVALFIADAAHPLLALFDGIASAGAAVPYAAIAVAPTIVNAAAAAVACVALVLACVSRFPARPLLIAAGGAALLPFSPVLPALPLLRRGQVELHMLDVGQGDAVVLRTDRGRWVVFDAGRQWTGGDAGRAVVAPYVMRRGGTVAAFILSHAHADHVGGASSVLRMLRPAQYWDAAFAVGSDVYAASLETAAAERIRWRRVAPRDTLRVDGVTIRILAPDSAWTSNLADPNSASTVALVQYGRVRFLLVGDAERAEEEWLLANAAADLQADVLKVGHHGSVTSTGAPFLAAVRPALALVSVGARNTYGHPNAGVMTALERAGARVLRTDRVGTVVIRTDGSTVAAEWEGGRWRSQAASPGQR